MQVVDHTLTGGTRSQQDSPPRPPRLTWAAADRLKCPWRVTRRWMSPPCEPWWVDEWRCSEVKSHAANEGGPLWCHCYLPRKKLGILCSCNTVQLVDACNSENLHITAPAHEAVSDVVIPFYGHKVLLEKLMWIHFIFYMVWFVIVTTHCRAT